MLHLQPDRIRKNKFESGVNKLAGECADRHLILYNKADHLFHAIPDELGRQIPGASIT